MTDAGKRAVILVCGGRDYADREAVERAIDAVAGGVDTVIHGDAEGADRLVAGYCTEIGIHTAAVAPNWPRWGRAAGPRRNAAMLALRPDKVIAFPGGRGTEDCIRQAERAGIPVERVG